MAGLYGISRQSGMWHETTHRAWLFWFLYSQQYPPPKPPTHLFAMQKHFRLEYQLQMRGISPWSFEAKQSEMFYVVPSFVIKWPPPIFSHFICGKTSRTLLHYSKCSFQVEGIDSHRVWKVKSFNACRKADLPTNHHHTQPWTGRTRIVKIGFDIRKFGIDAQTTRNIVELSLRVQTLELRKRIKSNVTATFYYFRKLTVGISRSVSMRRASHFLESQSGFGQRTGCRIRNVFAHNRKSAP